MSGAERETPFPGLNADEIAQRSAATMWATDHASQGLTMEIVAIGPGTAVLQMTIAPDMANGFGMAHGGFLFTLADSAFAYACNSHGLTTVAAHCGIHFLTPAKVGERVTAAAREVSRAGRSGIYDVRLQVGERTIAEFRGTSRTIGGPFIKTTPSSDPSA